MRLFTRMVLPSLFLLLTSARCKTHQWYSISVHNDTNDTIYFHVAGWGNTHIYPDTNLEGAKPALIRVLPLRSNAYYQSGPWEEYFSDLPADTVSIFFFDDDTIDAYTWDRIRDEYKILNRYDLSFEELQSTNFQVRFPR